jgi:hypothetical protein
VPASPSPSKGASETSTSHAEAQPVSRQRFGELMRGLMTSIRGVGPRSGP